MRSALRIFCCVAFGFCCAVGLGGSSAAQWKSFDFHYSVFALAWNEDDASAWGTVFVIDHQGTMLTANHVVKDVLAAAQRSGHPQPTLGVNMHFQGGSGRWVPVKIVLQRDDLDIAVLRPAVPIGSPERHGDAPPFQPLELDERQVNITEPVFIVGYPISASPYLGEEMNQLAPYSKKLWTLMLQIDPLVTTATVAGVAHRVGPPTAQNKGRYEVLQDYLVLSHPSGQGNSGGPVISVQTGRVIGVLTRGRDADKEGYSFAVLASQIAKDVLNDPRLREP